MNDSGRLKVLMVAEVCDPNGVGESRDAFNWARRLSDFCNITLLCVQPRFTESPVKALPGVEVVSWEQPDFYRTFPEFYKRVKPHYAAFYMWARRWIRRARSSGQIFDLGHQITPNGMRYPSPLTGTGIPYIIGPVGGSLPTPAGFRKECNSSALLFSHLRNIDQIRFRFDPLLRATYKNADLVIGSSDYVKELLSSIPLRRFETHAQNGYDDLGPVRESRIRKPGELRLVHVGRTVRTKGLRDAIRALAKLKEYPDISLECAGDGEDLEFCKQEARDLGVQDRIIFHGRLTRDEVEELYLRSDAMLFPSFREPAGHVIFEAMRNSLPLITTNIGGPGSLVDDESGIRVKVETPEQFAGDLAQAIQRLATDQELLERLSRGARTRVEKLGLWPSKLKIMLQFYQETAKKKSREVADQSIDSAFPERELIQ